tara:strand:+ start:3039 stop:3602 length:564 start_codon:yes stop_codon:yes gene_type:complete
LEKNINNQEFLEVYTSKGKKTGKKKSKTLVHKEGLFHVTVHVWIFTKNREVLIQKRARNKLLNPGIWDVSVAGHVNFKEKIIDAAIRETFEETGMHIKKKELIKIGEYLSINNSKDIVDKEFHHTYILKMHTGKINLNFKNDEVEKLKLISIKEMKNLISKKNNKFFIGKNQDYYKDVIKKISKLTK